MKTEDFSYELPSVYIAQTPLEPRDSSRLLIFHRSSKSIEHNYFYNLCEYLNPGDILVVNQTRVLKARLIGYKIPSGGRIELLLIKRLDEFHWESLVGGKGLNEGTKFHLSTGSSGIIEEEKDGARRIIRFDMPIDDILEKIGRVPLPPYIHLNVENPDRYQTIYASEPGSAAAPTAGLHFTQELLQKINEKGIRTASVTLHIGLDTFLPVQVDDPKEHKIHSEWCFISQETADLINDAQTRGKHIIAVGTTSVRSLESAAKKNTGKYKLGFFEGQTDLFILPGYSFKIINGLVTNFHLPRSTLIMMISSIINPDELLITYDLAKRLDYRFYSFGDAMLIL